MHSVGEQNLDIMARLNQQRALISLSVEQLRALAVMLVFTLVLCGEQAVGQTNDKEFQNKLESEDFIVGRGAMPDGLEHITKGMSYSDVVLILVEHQNIKSETAMSVEGFPLKSIEFLYYNAEFEALAGCCVALIFFDKDYLISKIRYGLYY